MRRPRKSCRWSLELYHDGQQTPTKVLHFGTLKKATAFGLRHRAQCLSAGCTWLVELRASREAGVASPPTTRGLPRPAAASTTPTSHAGQAVAAPCVSERGGAE